MRYEIDRQNKIVDFYITDEFGKEHHDALTIEETLKFLCELLDDIAKG